MKTGKRWSCWRLSSATLLAMPMLLAGCATDRAAVERNLLGQNVIHQNEAIAQHYCVGCPDVLTLAVDERPEFAGRYPIGPDGRIDLGDYGNPRVEGRTIPEITAALAEEFGVTQASVDLRIAEHRSQHLLLFGEVIGWQRSVPYQGQETVLDLLRRVGGITAGAEPTDVYVVRPHLGESQRPEVIHVDLHAIVVKGDPRTNVRLLPFDQIYVGETRRCQIERAIPPWLRGVYLKFRSAKTTAPM
jgi:polysaccharide biosynthesis/export protein